MIEGTVVSKVKDYVTPKDGMSIKLFELDEEAVYTVVLKTKNKDSYVFNEPKNRMGIFIMNGAIEFLKGTKKTSKGSDKAKGIQDAFEGFVKALIKRMNVQK